MKYILRSAAVLATLFLVIFLGSNANAQGGGLDPKGTDVIQKKGTAEITYQQTKCEQVLEPASGSYETEINVYNAEEGVTNNDVEVEVFSAKPAWDQGSFRFATGGLATVSGGFTTETPWTIPDVPTDDWDVTYDRSTGQIEGQLVTSSDSSLVAWPADLISDCLGANVQIPEGNTLLQNRMATGTTMTGTLTEDNGELTIQGEFFNASGSVAFQMKVNY